MLNNLMSSIPIGIAVLEFFSKIEAVPDEKLKNAAIEGEFEGKLNKIQQNYVSDILGSDKHILSLIDDIMDISKIEEGNDKGTKFHLTIPLRNEQ